MERPSSTACVPGSVARKRLKMLACSFLGLLILSLVGTGGYLAYKKKQYSSTDSGEPLNITANAIQNPIASLMTTTRSDKSVTTPASVSISSKVSTLSTLSQSQTLYESVSTSSHTKTATPSSVEPTATSNNLKISSNNTNTIKDTALNTTKSTSIPSTEQTATSTIATSTVYISKDFSLTSSIKAISLPFTVQISVPFSATTSHYRSNSLISAEQTSKSVNTSLDSNYVSTPLSTNHTSTGFKATSSSPKSTIIASAEPTTTGVKTTFISTTATAPTSTQHSADPCLGSSALCNNESSIDIMSNYCECDQDEIWTVVQRRFDGSVDFYRNWTEYKEGFGDIAGEFWLGNEAIHRITSSAKYSLKINITGWDNITKFAYYDIFRITDETDDYRLTVDGFSGDAGDSLTRYHNGQMFSTWDRDNDSKSKENLAVGFCGAWWFGSLIQSNLNGRYQSDPYTYGINWMGYGYGMRYSMKETKMFIKPINKL